MNDAKSYDALSAVALLVGFYEGLLPFAAKLFGWSPALSLPAHMDPPAWWIVAGVALIAAVIALDRLDTAKNRRFGPDA
jgi:hypothetical protein